MMELARDQMASGNAALRIVLLEDSALDAEAYLEAQG